MLRAIGVSLVVLFAVCVAGLLGGCYHPPPRQLVGAPPPTPAQIASCGRLLALKNWSTVLASGFGGAGGVAGAAAADVQGNQRAQVGVEIGAVSAAAIGVGFVVAGAISGNDYGSDRCDAILASP